MHLPINGASRPKGPFYGQSGVAVRYIALASIKVKKLDKRSIAHFYRDCIVWPRLNPSVVLAPAEQSIRATTTKRLFMGGNGEVNLTAALHRPYFIAGTQVPVNVSVQNSTKKLIKSLALTLYRSTVVFKRKLGRDSQGKAGDVDDLDACQTNTTLKVVATSTLEMAQGFPRGHASTGGWWPGVPSGERSDFSHLLLLPPDALTHTRERLIEVEYTIRISLNAGSLTSDVYVTLPIRIVNLLSLDPPPTFTLGEPFSNMPPPQTRLDANSVAEVPLQNSGSFPRSPGESDFSDFASDPNDEGFHESDSEEAPQEEGEAQLGNLSICEDAEDLVQHAIVSAQMSHGSGNADRFPESIDKDSSWADTERLEELVEEGSEDEKASNQAELHLEPTPCRPTRPRGPSSFAQRVQNKLQVAVTARQPVAPRDPEVSEKILSDQDVPRPSKQNTSPTDPCLDLPPRSAISCVSGYQVASSSFLNNRYFGSAESPSVNPRPAGSRLLPRPPSIVGLPFPEGLNIYAAGPIPSSADLNRAETNGSPDELKAKRPSIVPGGSASSVKAKIKELEERVRAAEEY
ncbi:hypothetical protein B0H17DRAFT_606680 [Mycena rosella]|uniref:Arrestin C-terminal-like domain-containing protein n=1 Tax=Mycena rosella TaxID=1033263 RepID=A0AAD7GV14_MYCRO|nr:hypothetical protein B0H17DRAFT_606680 [Mycena rosella]